MPDPHMNLIEWREHFFNCEDWMDFVRELHAEAGYPADVFVSPQHVLSTIQIMRRSCEIRSKEMKAKAISQLEHIEREGSY